LLGLGHQVDTMVVYSSAQQQFITDRLRFPADRVHLTPFTVDTGFFAPGQAVAAESDPMICTAGLEFRDYATLVAAARDLPARVVIAAASPWSKRKDETAALDVPANVEVCRLGFADLRQLYADARLVVMPLQDVEFQAGITTILEGMAMGRVVVCTRTRGQTDVLVDGSTGVYVPPGDAERLRAALQELLDDPDRAARLGAAAREYVVAECDVAVYAKRLAEVVDAAAARHAAT
jgi:glycosyltransferase involved in cell wall biosynthesis